VLPATDEPTEDPADEPAEDPAEDPVEDPVDFLYRVPVDQVVVRGERFAFWMDDTVGTRLLFWKQGLRMLHQRGDAGKSEFIKLLRNPTSFYEDNPRVRALVLEVVRPLRLEIDGKPVRGWKRNLPKTGTADRRWPRSARQQLAAALERAHVVRPSNRPRILSFDLSSKERLRLRLRSRRTGFGRFLAGEINLTISIS
jgi:hypothetical protein